MTPASAANAGHPFIRLRKYQDVLRAEELGAFNLQTLLRRIRRPRIAIPAISLVIAISLVAVWFFKRQAKIRWAREKALPEIYRLIEESWPDLIEAYQLAEVTEKYIPSDPKLSELFSKCSMNISIKTEPDGAQIYMKGYSAPNSEWEYIGISPIESIRVPFGYIRWKIEKEDYETILAVSSTFSFAFSKKIFSSLMT